MIYIASDHQGYILKCRIFNWLKSNDVAVSDLGTNSTDRVDFPIYANKVAEKIKEDNDNRGILICRTGIGMSMAINRHKGVRGALCKNKKIAKLCREHNNANVLVLGAEDLSFRKAKKLIKEFLNTEFLGGKYQDRVEMLDIE